MTNICYRYFVSTGKPYKDDSSDSDSVFNDTASVISGVSYASSIRGENDETTCNFKDELDDDGFDVTTSEIDDFESKFDQVFDNLQTVKSGKSRLQQYDSLAKALTTRFCCEYLDDR